MKLWQKNKNSLEAVDKFTVGKDREMDLQLAPFDVLGSLAHIKMLHSVNLLSGEDLEILTKELKKIYKEIEAGTFRLEEDVEDIHSQVELLLTQRLGDAGKKIHSGRSRNDQVMVDLKLFLRDELEILVKEVNTFFHQLLELSEKYKNYYYPGYTHFQVAMPSSFGLWFGAYAESLVDDMHTLQAAYRIVNKNPLGSAAGYGSSFPLDRTMTTNLLGFENLNYNVVYAQMGRGKLEQMVSQALSNVAATISKMAMDACVYNSQNFGFISFPDELTTGSSIMPHKKNPDVFELIRGHANKIKALPNELMLIASNLPSGYHRDLQLLKENFFPAFDDLKNCMSMASLMFDNIRIKEDVLKDDKYKYLFSVEEVNKLVLQGVPFRDAYKKVGIAIEKEAFDYSTDIHHTHEGSLGNLCNDEIKKMMDEVLMKFGFEKTHEAIGKLLKS